MTVEDGVNKDHVFEEIETRQYLGVRHIQFFLLFLAIVISFGFRANLSMGIVAMTDNSTSATNSSIPTFPEWEDYKELMLSSFFWGIILLQIGAGQIAEKYGPKRFLCLGMAVSSLFAILIPVCGENLGYIGVIVCRFFQGLAQGFLYPSVHYLISHWSSTRERARVVTFTYAGGPLGTVISNYVTGAISSTEVGWPVAFYVYGFIGFIWSIGFYYLGSDSPETYKRISEEELKYIQGNMEATTEVKEIGKTPWKSIATSLPVWAIIISHCGQNWSFYTLMTEIPTYLDKMLDFDMKSNGLLSAAPYLALYVLSVVLSPIADFLIVKNYVSRGTSRKIFNSIGLYVPAFALIVLSFVGRENKAVAVSLLIVAVGTNAAYLSGFNVNHMDLSPNFAGTLMGITNTFSNISSITAPLAISGLKEIQGYEDTDSELWLIVFCFAAAFNIVAATFFLIFASGKVQPWNDVEPLKN